MSAYTGSLSHKRKADLFDIANALGLKTDTDAKVNDLVEAIQSHLKTNETELINSPQFKGLYGRRTRQQSSDSDSIDVKDPKQAVESTVRKGRKSVNKALDRVSNVDPSNIALPESPINVNRIVEVAEQAKDAAAEQLAVALAPAQEMIPADVSRQLQRAQHQLVRIGGESRERVDKAVRLLQSHLSRPEHLVSAAIGVELLLLLCHVVNFYDHAVFFPPAGGEKGTFASLLHSLFFWLPSFALTFRLPEWYAIRPSSGVWPAIAWWASTTVLPPYALSTLVSYVPQKSAGHDARQQGSRQPAPTADPLTFALIRLAILLYPFTNSAPSSFVDSLELSGNTQVRALGAGLLAALLLVGRLSQKA